MIILPKNIYLCTILLSMKEAKKRADIAKIAVVFLYFIKMYHASAGFALEFFSDIRNEMKHLYIIVISSIYAVYA